MTAQLDKLLDTERQAQATIQVIPFELGAHAAQTAISFCWNLKKAPTSHQSCSSKD